MDTKSRKKKNELKFIFEAAKRLESLIFHVFVYLFSHLLLYLFIPLFHYLFILDLEVKVVNLIRMEQNSSQKARKLD